MNIKKLVAIVAVAIITVLLIIIIIITNTLIIRKIPFITKKDTNWAIGIYTGSSPFNLSPGNIENPVLTYKDVTDIKASFVADPFLVYENNTWYMFFEVWNNETNHGDIALATSNNGLNWDYKQVVLDESFHLSYPYVFKWENVYYMIMEGPKGNSIRLYKANAFPNQWSDIGSLIKGDKREIFRDSSIFRYDKK